MKDFHAKTADASAALISCLRANLVECGAMVQLGGITSAHIVSPVSEIFVVLMDIWRAGERYDFISLCQRLRKTGGMDRFSDTNQISTLLHTATDHRGAETHIRSLLECGAARRLHELGQRLSAQAFDTTIDVADFLEQARADLSAITAAPVTTRIAMADFAAQVVESLQRELTEEAGEEIEFGLGLDEGAGPFCRGDLVVIAADTKRGKSALCGNILENAAAAGKSCALFSLEMTGAQNATRVLSSQTGINIRELRAAIKAQRRNPDLFTDKAEDAVKTLKAAAAGLKPWKLAVFEEASGVEQIVAEMLRMKFTGGLDLTVVDYAQILRGIRTQGDNREREVASISGLLKRAAVQTKSVVILASQVTEKDGKVHLRESKALGQDANCVLFLEGPDHERTVRVGAARSAPTGTDIPVFWNPNLTKFERK